MNAEVVAEFDWDADVGVEKLNGFQVYEHFECGKGKRTGGVNHGRVSVVPAATVSSGTFAGEGFVGMLCLNDTPRSNRQENTPCARRPSRSSTSRAPGSVSA